MSVVIADLSDIAAFRQFTYRNLGVIAIQVGIFTSNELAGKIIDVNVNALRIVASDNDTSHHITSCHVAFRLSRQVLDEQTAVCEEVACQMVKGACRSLNTDYAISATGFAGPTGGTKDIPVGTIWLACGTFDHQVTMKVQEDHGRDINLAIATNKAMLMFLDFLKSETQTDEKQG